MTHGIWDDIEVEGCHECPFANPDAVWCGLGMMSLEHRGTVGHLCPPNDDRGRCPLAHGPATVRLEVLP